MPDLLRLFRRRKPVADAVALDDAKSAWHYQNEIDIIIREVGPAEVRDALSKAGYSVGYGGRFAEGTVIIKPGRCEGCRDHHLLTQGLNSGRWLCSYCHLGELCET